MNIKEIRQLASWLGAANLSVLHIQRPGFDLLLRRGAAAAPVLHVEPPARVEVPVASIKASGPGLFFSHHPDERTPWVKPGDSVRNGQLVGVLQIGHLLLPVRSQQDGQVSAVRAAEGEQVGYGQPLFDLAG